jgi:hypothetical protein
MDPSHISRLSSARGYSTTAVEGEIMYGVPQQPITCIPLPLEIFNGISMIHISGTCLHRLLAVKPITKAG